MLHILQAFTIWTLKKGCFKVDYDADTVRDCEYYEIDDKAELQLRRVALYKVQLGRPCLTGQFAT